MRVGRWPYLSGSILSGFAAPCEAKADQERPIHRRHGLRGKDAKETAKSLLVDGANLVAKHEAVLLQSSVAPRCENVDRRPMCDVLGAGQGDHNRRGGKTI